ncbi:MAG: hypothetical protein FWE44_03515 [Defluviitaleaceae bacterium]|nr:hypothetical protein [Defluviitaleaceae bacterium]
MKIKHRIFGALLFGAAAIGLVACASLENEVIEPYEPEQHRVFTIEEFGATIVDAGNFWEDLWSFRGAFAWENFEQFDWGEPLPEHYDTFSPEHTAWLERLDAKWEEYWARIPEHLQERGIFDILLPSSGFVGLDDIRNYLSQYYSDAWLDNWTHSSVSHVGNPFYEYNGMLFVEVTRAGLARPNWNTAQHVLVEQGGGRAVVETRILWGGWHRAPYHQIEGWETIYHFVFNDGKIYSFDIIEEWAERTLPLSIEELGSTIVGSGWFWEFFRRNNIDLTIPPPPHLHALNYLRLLPIPEFYSLQAIHDYVARHSSFYTQNWMSQILEQENPLFLEYSGEFYMFVLRDDPQPIWQTATHTLVEQNGNHSVVDTQVLLETGQEALRRFTFVYGRIDSVEIIE